MKLFVAALLACVASLAAGQGTACQEHGQLLPNEEDCTTFLQCSFGYLFLHNCPPDLTYHPALERCDYPSDDDSCPKKLRSAQPVDCPPVGSDDLAVQVPNPEDCGSFYKCDENGIPHLHYCQPGLEYNAELEVCDWPGQAGCSKSRRN